MMLLFPLIWTLVLLIPQLLIRFSLFGMHLTLGFTTILVIYVAFNFPFFQGLLTVAVISYILETFTIIPHGYLVLAHLVLYVVIQLLVARIYTESYLTKSIWVFPFSLATLSLLTFIMGIGERVDVTDYWINMFVQSFFNVMVSFPFFILLDITFEWWLQIFTRTRKNLTGADFYQVKSSQRKYF